MNLPLERGADPNIADDQGNTPLHFATEISPLPIIKTLLLAGARADVQDKLYQKPHDWAGRAAVKKLLKLADRRHSKSGPTTNKRIPPSLKTAAAPVKQPSVPALLLEFFAKQQKVLRSPRIRGLPTYQRDAELRLVLFSKPNPKILKDYDIDLESYPNMIPFARLADEARILVVDASKPDRCPVLLWDEGTFHPTAKGLREFVDRLEPQPRSRAR